jgi:uncharacterized protein (TIGR01777 family)
VKVVVAGSSGLIGSALLTSLRADGHEVVTLVRREPRGAYEVRWDPALGARGADLAVRDAVDSAGAVVNLAGAGVAGKRWNDGYKREILDSRVSATTCLATAIAESDNPTAVLVSGSAGGFYGDTGPNGVDETGPRGSTFLARVCVAWEAAAEPARERGVRVVHPRTTTVADPDGGAFGRWLPILRLGVGGRLGSGRQWWSLISLADEVGAIRHCIDHDDIEGPVNLSAPEQVTNGELTAALGRALHRPTLAAAPKVALNAVLGEFADELLLDQRLLPGVLERTGYSFAHPTVAAIIDDLLG